MEGKEQGKNDSGNDFIYCSMCSEKLRTNVRYCWKCNTDQAKFGPVDWVSKADTKNTKEKPQAEEKKVMSFQSYKKAKASEQQAGSFFRTKKKAKLTDENEEVTVNLGLKQLNKEELKTIRGKRLPVMVPKHATYSVLLERGIKKWSAFDRNFDASKKYVVLYEDGTEAQFMPGQTKEFFDLSKYKIEVGKDFKRIVFYLCEEQDFAMYEKILQQDNGSDDDENNSNGFADEMDQIEVDAMLAEQLDDEWNGFDNDEITGSSLPAYKHTSSFTSASTSSSTSTSTSTYGDIVKALASKVNNDKQFFLVTRRKAPLSHILSLWRRQALKSHPTNILRVHYHGEEGIDSGAMALEFFENSLREIGEVMFPDGAPIISSNHVQNGNFRTCGEIVAASLAQGGPPPCFLDKCCYQSAFKEIDMMAISADELTEKEKELLEQVRSDCANHSDLILENNYTGVINQDHIEDIIQSLKVSFVSRRCLYMREFMIGLNHYGLADMIRKYPDQCEPLFVNGDLKGGLVPDADYLFSVMQPIYSEEGSSKKCIEEKMMDNLQNTLNLLEDGHMTGHFAVVAWKDAGNDDDDEVDGDKCSAIKGQEEKEVGESFENPSLTIAGVMGWLTGMQHKPINGEKLKILVNFDHCCLERNPKHTVCFPLVSACARRITFPVAHMQNLDKFKELFITAYCKGQAFGKP